MGCVFTNYTKQGDPVAPCTPGVRHSERTRQFTRLWQTICSERHFHTPAVRICTASSSHSRTPVVGCMYTSCTKLGGPIAPRTAGVLLRDCSRQFIGLWQTICSERHFPHLLHGSVQLPEVGRHTAALGCVYTNCTKLGGPVAPCTPGVRLRDHSRQFIGPW